MRSVRSRTVRWMQFYSPFGRWRFAISVAASLVLVASGGLTILPDHVLAHPQHSLSPRFACLSPSTPQAPCPTYNPPVYVDYNDSVLQVDLLGVAGAAWGDLWGVGYYIAGSPLILHGDTTHWTPVTPAPIDGTSGSFYAVSASSTNDVWAVGEEIISVQGQNTGAPLVEHWDGKQWNQIANPSPAPDARLYSVSARSASDVWAVGYVYNSTNSPQVPFIEHWDGQKWTVSVVPLPSIARNVSKTRNILKTSLASTIYGNVWLNSVTALAPDNVWAVGAYSTINGYIYTLVEHWNGQTWSVVPSPNYQPITTNANNNLHAIAAVSPTDIWATGNYYVSQTQYGAFMEHWDGTNWTIQQASLSLLPNMSDLGPVTIAPDHSVYVAGDRSTMPIIAHWDGINWHYVTTYGFDAANDTGNYTGIVVLGPLAVAAVGNYQRWDCGSCSFTAQSPASYSSPGLIPRSAARR